MVKKAVLIGINYPGTEDELRGCVNDVKRMQKTLIELYGFSDENITVLIDTDQSYTEPTGKNIRQALSELVESAKSGDVLFVHYSGHGTTLPPESGEEDDTGVDECIVPTDSNFITDDDFREIVNKVPNDCSITIVSDSCHSGGLIDKSKEQIGESTTKNREFKCPFGFFTSKNSTTKDNNDVVKTRSLPLETLIKTLKQKTGKDDIQVGNIRTTLFDFFGEDSTPKVKKFVQNLQERVKDGLFLGNSKKEVYGENGILLSGCQTDQTSADIKSKSTAYGAFTNAIHTILMETKGKVSNKDLILKTRKLLEKQRYPQRPGLYCSDKYLNAQFIC